MRDGLPSKLSLGSIYRREEPASSAGGQAGAAGAGDRAGLYVDGDVRVRQGRLDVRLQIVAERVGLPHGQRAVQHQVEVHEAVSSGLARAQRMILHNLVGVVGQDVAYLRLLVLRQARIHPPGEGGAGGLAGPPPAGRHASGTGRTRRRTALPMTTAPARTIMAPSLALLTYSALPCPYRWPSSGGREATTRPEKARFAG